MKKFLTILLSLLLVLSLVGCGSSDKKEESPSYKLSIFGKDYSLPVTLADVKKNGVEVVEVFMDAVSSNDSQNVFLSKDGEYIRVSVYNPGNQRVSVTDDSLVISYFSVEYDDVYMNCKDIPSIKFEGVGIGDTTDNLTSLFGDCKEVFIDNGIVLRLWEKDVTGMDLSISAVIMSDSVYSLEVTLPKK